MIIIDRRNHKNEKTSFFKRTITTTILLLAAIPIYSQTEGLEKNPYIYTKNSFKVSLGNGFNRTKFTVIDGVDKPRAGVGLAPRLNFDYRFSLGDHFGINIGAGLGAFPFRYKVDAKEGFYGTEGWNYFQITEYQLHSGLNIGLDYNYWLNDKYSLMSGVDVGGIAMGGLYSQIGSYGETVQEYGLVLNAESGLIPYLRLSTGVNRVLKNDNLLGLSLSYEYFLQPVFTGNYTMYNNTSSGTITSKGHNIGLTLGYTFTRAKKMKRAEDLTIHSDDISFKDAKKKFKKDKRYIDPKSTFFDVSSGMLFARNQSGFGDHLLKSGSFASWIVSANVEKGIKNNFFWQAGLSISETWSYIRINRPDTFWSFGGNEFVSVQASFGVGTRLISKKSNINFLNVSAGLSVGAHASPQGPSGFSSGSGEQDGETQYQFRVDYTTKRNIYPTVYLNLSRDFQMTKSLYLSLDYRFNLGLTNIVEGDVEYSEQPDLSNVLYDQINIKGTSNAFQLGIKYKLSPRSK